MKTDLKIDERFNTDESAQVGECGCDGTAHPTELERVKLTVKGHDTTRHDTPGQVRSGRWHDMPIAIIDYLHVIWMKQHL